MAANQRATRGIDIVFIILLHLISWTALLHDAITPRMRLSPNQEDPMRHIKIALFTSITIFLTGLVFAAAAEVSLRALPDNSQVTVSGTITHVKDERTFTLKNATGKANVDIVSKQSVVLKEG